jgi:DMSO/TMAO reductase YedYZ molybdopterin-dependent catalytic subunit
MPSDVDHTLSQHVTFLPGQSDGSERDAVTTLDPAGFFIRHPPPPHALATDMTDDAQLFQTIHMGAAVVDEHRWKLVLDGMVERPLSFTLAQLKSMPRTTVTSFHECYGSPVAPPIHALWRIGNVEWTGVRLCDLLRLAVPKPGAKFVWSQGLDSGSFAGVSADRYEKDLPIAKAMGLDVLIAYEMNGEPLSKHRGGPARLVVPGWFGTNSTKWICRLSLQSHRAVGPFTTKFYNEVDPTDPEARRIRPVWTVEPNSMIVRPQPGEVLRGHQVQVWGRAWGCEEITQVDLSLDGGETWLPATTVRVAPRQGFGWQLFQADTSIPQPGRYRLTARATDTTGLSQPLRGRRNHVHSIDIEVLGQNE